jgi:hypothetical protein
MITDSALTSKDHDLTDPITAHPMAEGSMVNVTLPTALQTATDLITPESFATARHRCISVSDTLVKANVFESSLDPQWRISTTPFFLERKEVDFFESLGSRLLGFYRALNRLYLDSVKGKQPAWVHEYLDQGKPPALLEYGRMKRFRDILPDVIRPDVILTDHGMVITELDSVPGGIGSTAILSGAYATLGDTIVCGAQGISEGFALMLQSRLGNSPGCVAIVVSDEAEDYRAEMSWIASNLKEQGTEAYCIHPRDLRFTEESLFIMTPSGEKAVSLIYRFYELFDLKNIPKSELVMYSAKKDRVAVTPPYKPWMEEKLAFALLHHPMLESFWTKAFGLETFDVLHQLMPKTWILDPRPIPPSAVIPNLLMAGSAVSDWHQLAQATQRQRQYVIKPSGFSELAWGSRGVVIGHDIPQTEWTSALDRGLDSFETTPHILQEFHKGRQYSMTYMEERTQEMVPMQGRVRLSPYYFVSGDEARLGGILATVCPKDKKVIHGMRDAILAPCAIAEA